ncbi:glycogen synthase GlgA [Vibrio sinensis]|uniref:Glycogen synthase n=1 Tax=Vibrio sinensis TaxID=2302434 RepID=A0A3A6R9I5_9VIBR|nr:glycogen synthase GlgA [Vibrio sinensis]RJX73762.1 glycogen synthase GlgA [Vibrio sinensis]
MVTKDLSILFVASEVEGLIKSGGLADVAQALPKALLGLNQDVRIAMPAYSKIAGIEQATVVLSTTLEHWPHTEYQVRELSVVGVTVYAIECAQFFDRSEMYAENNVAYADNGARFSFFSAASLDMLPKLGFQPQIVHANDWHTGFIPFLLNHRYGEHAFYQGMKSVLSIHNAVFKGLFSYDEVQSLPEFHSYYVPDAAVSPSHVTMLKAGVMNASKINAVSPTYAQELTTELGSHGMGKYFSQRAHDLVGILNGCDYSSWNPTTDLSLPQTYKAEAKSMQEGKQACKRALQERAGLEVKDTAMYGMVCRLTNQKGIHYLLPILADFLKHDVQIVIVGTGDPSLASQLRVIASQFPHKFAFLEAYDNDLAHLVEAGSDFFLMPSEFEPCGLNQIYSMAYGTLPIVRAVGGLKDSVVDYDTNSDLATGFIFHEPEPYALLLVMQRSLLLYLQYPEEIERLKLFAMQQNFSWSTAAQEYLSLYYAALDA